MSLNEFKTHMLLMGWTYEKGITTKNCQTYLWKIYPHIVQLTTCCKGAPISIIIFKNWEKAMRGRAGADSSRMNFSNPRKALDAVDDLL